MQSKLMSRPSLLALAIAMLMPAAPAIALQSSPSADMPAVAPSVGKQTQVGGTVSENETKKASDFPQDNSDLKADARVTYGKLDNGLRYAVMRNATPKNAAALRMRIDTGSLNETEVQRGLAHFLEHMAFNGSKNVPEGEMVKRLERLGLAFGADTNASTGFEQTLYKLNLPKNDEEIVNEAFFLMRETASNLTLDSEAIERERGVIASEKRARDSINFRAFINRLGFFTEGSGLTDRLPIGTDETIANVPREEFVKFYRGFYHPENTFITFVGDLNTDIATAKIKEYFGDWDSAQPATIPAERRAAEITPGKIAYYRDEGLLTSITLGALHPYRSETDNSATRRKSLLRQLGSSIINRRMRRKVEDGSAPYLSAWADRYIMEDVIDGMILSVRSAPDVWDESIAAADLEVRRALQFGFSEIELKEQLANHKRSLETAVERANTRQTYANGGFNYASAIVSAFDESQVFTSPQDDLAAFNRMARNITIADIEAEFRNNWRSYDDPAIYLETGEEVTDAEAKIKAAFAAARKVEATKLEFAEVEEFRYTDFGAAGKTVQDEYVKDADAHLVKFANNVRLNFKKTDFDDGTIYVRVRVGDGFISMPRADEGLRSLASSLLADSGVEGHTSDDLTTIFAGKRVSTDISVSRDNNAFEIVGATDKSSLRDQLNLMAAHVTAPAYTTQADEQYRRRLQAWYPTHDSSPGSVLAKEAPRLVRSGDTRYGYGDLESFLAPSIQDVRSWLDPQLKDGLVEITIVGDVDKQVAIDQVAHTFGALPARKDAKGNYPAARKLSFPDGNAGPFKYYHRGNGDQAIVRVYWPSQDASDRVVPYKMQVLRSIFRNRLTDVLREEMGATYSPGAGAFSNEMFDGYGYIFAHVTADPATVEEVREAVLKVGEELRSGSMSEDIFRRALQPIVKDLESTLENNGYWMSVLGDAQTSKDGLAGFRVRERTYRTMTLQQINDIAKSTFNREDAVSVYILPK